jgi:uncharacterized protein YqeY
MSIQETIKADLKNALKEKHEERKSAIRVILGEFSRFEKKELTDDEAIKVLKKLVKSEKETLETKGETEDSAFLLTVNSYLPKEATAEEIEAWIRNNIDFSSFKNKMQAMKPVMAHFGSSADGNLIKEILSRL